MLIKGYHAHVYFDENTLTQAQSLCELASDTFPLTMGRVHQKPVGPHPMWSCQLAFKAELFGDLIPWLNHQRDNLTVFVHPLTGDDLADHTRYAMWLGDSQTLDVSIFD